MAHECMHFTTERPDFAVLLSLSQHISSSKDARQTYMYGNSNITHGGMCAGMYGRSQLREVQQQQQYEVPTALVGTGV